MSIDLYKKYKKYKSKYLTVLKEKGLSDMNVLLKKQDNSLSDNYNDNDEMAIINIKKLFGGKIDKDDVYLSDSEDEDILNHK